MRPTINKAKLAQEIKIKQDIEEYKRRGMKETVIPTPSKEDVIKNIKAKFIKEEVRHEDC